MACDRIEACETQERCGERGKAGVDSILYTREKPVEIKPRKGSEREWKRGKGVEKNPRGTQPIRSQEPTQSNVDTKEGRGGKT